MHGPSFHIYRYMSHNFVSFFHKPPRLPTSYIQLCLARLAERSLELVVGKRRAYPLRKELVDLLRRAPYEALGLEQRVQLALDRVEVRVRANTFNKVVL